MSAQGNGASRYSVHASEAVLDAIRRIHRRARQQARNELVTNALRVIAHQLEHHPMRFGEPLYGMSAMRLQVRTAVVRPIAVDYAVDEPRRLVFIKSVKLLSPNT